MGESAPLTMTLFKITDTQVTVSRYGRNGKEALKNEVMPTENAIIIP